jgi:hypothetical protein
MAKSSISLVSVQKPTSNTPVLQRRNKLTANIEQQIMKIGSFREGKRISREQFWVDPSGSIYFQLRYGKQPLELEKGKSTLKAGTFDDLVAHDHGRRRPRRRPVCLCERCTVEFQGGEGQEGDQGSLIRTIALA